jgi:heme exporter protein A
VIQLAEQTTETEVVDGQLAVRIAHLSKYIDDRPVLRDIDLEIRDGEFVALLGSNGAGKTTLLKVLASLTHATEGTVELFGQPVTRTNLNLRRRIGLVGHQSMLYQDLSARENLEFFARLYGLSDRQRHIARMLEMIGLSHRADDPIKAFSRGMTQRVAIARALLHGPDLILADEPFAGLDAPSAGALEDLLVKLNCAGRTIILVNHDIRQSLEIADRVVALRQGRIALDQPTRQLKIDHVLEAVVGS